MIIKKLKFITILSLIITFSGCGGLSTLNVVESYKNVSKKGWVEFFTFWCIPAVAGSQFTVSKTNYNRTVENTVGTTGVPFIRCKLALKTDELPGKTTFIISVEGKKQEVGVDIEEGLTKLIWVYNEKEKEIYFAEGKGYIEDSIKIKTIDGGYISTVRDATFLPRLKELLNSSQMGLLMWAVWDINENPITLDEEAVKRLRDISNFHPVDWVREYSRNAVEKWALEKNKEEH